MVQFQSPAHVTSYFSDPGQVTQPQCPDSHHCTKGLEWCLLQRIIVKIK